MATPRSSRKEMAYGREKNDGPNAFSPEFGAHERKQYHEHGGCASSAARQIGRLLGFGFSVQQSTDCCGKGGRRQMACDAWGVAFSDQCVQLCIRETVVRAGNGLG